MALEKLGCDDEVAAGLIASNYAEILDKTLDFFPDAEKTLTRLVQKKVKLALLTNGAGESQRGKINRFGLTRFFPICLIEGELGYGKPDRRFFKITGKPDYLKTQKLSPIELSITYPNYSWINNRLY